MRSFNKDHDNPHWSRRVTWAVVHGSPQQVKGPAQLNGGDVNGLRRLRLNLCEAFNKKLLDSLTDVREPPFVPLMPQPASPIAPVSLTSWTLLRQGEIEFMDLASSHSSHFLQLSEVDRALHRLRSRPAHITSLKYDMPSVIKVPISLMEFTTHGAELMDQVRSHAAYGTFGVFRDNP
eukprot:GHVN01000714.1.p1 GENE.GHVN01000714.1~~GHVN01000714.1.p1  ORF type:complete len:178 (-),score=38.88 GHVN01000714.1:565-1098(-)